MKNLSQDKNLTHNSSQKLKVRSNTKSPEKKIVKTPQEIFRSFKIITHKMLMQKHKTNQDTLNIKLINDIIYNEKAHIVATFKDNLISDDANEFLRRYYKNYEIKKKLPTIYEFYENYSKIFANYIILPASKYMYKNIQKKQKMIDNIQKNKPNKDKSKKGKEDNIFNTAILESIMNQTSKLEFEENDNNSLIINNSTESIEKLIETIIKSEKYINRNLNISILQKELSLNINTTSTVENDKAKKTETSTTVKDAKFDQLHSPTASISINTNNILNNISNFKLNKQASLKESEKKFKLKIEDGMSKDFKNGLKEKVDIVTRNTNIKKYTVLTSRKVELHRLTNALPNSETAPGSTIKSTYSAANTNRNSTNKNDNLNEYYKTTKQVTHKATSSMPKLTTKDMINNNHLLTSNNFKTESGNTITNDKNIFKSIDFNNIINNNKINNFNSKTCKFQNNACNFTSENEFHKNTIELKKTINNNPTHFNIENSQLKKKIANLVNATNQKNTFKNPNQSKNISNGLTMSGSNTNTNNAYNSTHSNLLNTKTNKFFDKTERFSLTNRNNDTNSIRALIHKDLFEVEPAKVNIEDNLRFSLDKLSTENLKEKKGLDLINNKTHSKTESKPSLTDRNIINSPNNTTGKGFKPNFRNNSNVFLGQTPKTLESNLSALKSEFEYKKMLSGSGDKNLNTKMNAKKNTKSVSTATKLEEGSNNTNTNITSSKSPNKFKELFNKSRNYMLIEKLNLHNIKNGDALKMFNGKINLGNSTTKNIINKNDKQGLKIKNFYEIINKTNSEAFNSDRNKINSKNEIVYTSKIKKKV